MFTTINWLKSKMRVGYQVEINTFKSIHQNKTPLDCGCSHVEPSTIEKTALFLMNAGIEFETRALNNINIFIHPTTQSYGKDNDKGN